MNDRTRLRLGVVILGIGLVLSARSLWKSGKTKLGDSCLVNDECKSGQCIGFGDAHLCSTICTDGDCPASMDCSVAHMKSTNTSAEHTATYCIPRTAAIGNR